MIKKIIELSKVFIKDYFQKIYIFNNNTKKINKKSMFSWLLIITVFAITFLSFKIINWLELRGQEILFLKIYFPIIATIFMFQAILISSNVFFFSKDLEYILPLPIKPVELLISKFNNVISITYGMEALFLAMPLLMYGIIAAKSIIYYLTMILVLILFPIFLITIISIIMLFVMQLTKFIKNKDIFQILIVVVISFVMTTAETYLLNSIFNDNIINIETNENDEVENAELNIEILNNKLDKLNNYFIIINPCISLLTNFNIINLFLQLLKLILISIITFFIFIFLGKILYLKNLLKNIAYINKKKNKKKIIKNKYKKNKIKNAYIKNEFKKIIKNPTFFIQCIFQYIFIIIILLFIINLFMPTIINNFQEEDLINKMGINNFALQCMCIIIGIIQIIFTLGNLSITTISREGKNAMVMKYIPVPLYKQFIWKNIPQILINIIAIIGMVVVIAINIPRISILYYLVGILIAMILNIINSFLMTVVDLRKTNLNWITETSAIKDNGNKLYQYVTTIVIILLLMYLTKIFKDVNIVKSFSIIIIILLIILFIINIFIKNNIIKLFKKIN